MLNEQHVKWIWVKKAVRDRSSKSYRLYSTFKNVDAIYFATHDQIEKLDFLDENDKELLSDKELKYAEDECRICEKSNIGITTIEDEDYPPLLREIENPPVVLYYYGNYEKAFSKPVITIVGTRNCTTYGQVTTSYISGTLSACGFTIGCGVAKGVDYAAMESAVKTDGSAILVLPDGLVATSYTNKYKIKSLRYNGVVITEHLLETPTTKYAYHERNRILSGIAIATIVTQAPSNSGALITADYALNQGRDVFAVPANIDMEQSAGSNKLIKDGAIPLLGCEDIISMYIDRFPDVVKNNIDREQLRLARNDEDDEFVKSEDFRRVILNDLDEYEKPVFELVSYKEVTVDYIIDRSQMNPADVLSILSSLESKGAITKLPGNKYKISI